jgi:hypothetical protein
LRLGCWSKSFSRRVPPPLASRFQRCLRRNLDILLPPLCHGVEAASTAPSGLRGRYRNPIAIGIGLYIYTSSPGKGARMPKPMETDPNTAVDLADLLAAQAIALDRLFMRAFGDILSGNARSLRDVRRALKAQAQSRTALRLLRALRAAEPKKTRNRTNRLLNEENPLHDQSLGQGHSEGDPLQALPQKVGNGRPSAGPNRRSSSSPHNLGKSRPARKPTPARSARPRMRSSTVSEAALSSSGSARSGSSYTTPPALSRWAKPFSGPSAPGQ